MDIGLSGNSDTHIRDLLKRTIRRSRKSPDQIAEELTIRLGRGVSKHMVDNWRSKSKSAWRLPADAVPALCEILTDDSLQRHLLSERLREDLKLGEHLRPMLQAELAKLARHARRRSRRA